MLLVILMSLFSWENAMADSVYSHINTPAFVAAAKHAYFTAVLSDPQRSAIISTAQSECGGRYEGTEISILEVSHAIDAVKSVVHGAAPDDYTLNFDTNADVKWIVTETIKCSMHGGHNKSMLHSRLMSGKDHAIVSYVYVGGVQSGTETVSGITRTFTAGPKLTTGLYKTPYGTVVP